MSNLAYHRPASAAEAAQLSAGDPDSKLLAGGQSIVPSLKLGLLAPSALIDLTGIAELRGIRLKGRTLTIGAMTTHAAVSQSPEVRSSIPALARLAEGIGDRQVRNRGTAGGSLANSDPAADYPAAALGLGAVLRTTRRTIAADTFFKGLFETALEPGELLTAVDFPVPERAAYVKHPQPASRFALVGVFVSQMGGAVRVAVTGAAPCVFRVREMEDALAKRFAPESLAGIGVAADALSSDIHGSAEYRAHLIPVLARQAVVQALG
ncbi:MAG TPA: xanthine dehydrogenase family protein subunit M [Steroidobacteraceae bacterium]|nr:xanthine dehydrogenase family protein subunit M [Steroidobacteraceae bacterium]